MRPATYEHEVEAEFLKKVFSNRDGSLQNTSFGLFAPDGKKRLSRGGRSPQMVWRDLDSFVRALESGPDKYRARRGQRSLPTVVDLRLGLNVAASDGLPLVVLVVPKGKSKQAKSLKQDLAALAWSDDLTASAHFVVLEDVETLKKMDGYRANYQVQVLKPDTYGLSAEIVGAVKLKDKRCAEKLADLYAKALGEPKDDRRHIRNGNRKGITWEPLLPVTDSHERRR